MSRKKDLLHPIALLAIATLLINDHVLKARDPGWLTGKLSDVAGMVFFPLLLDVLLRHRRLSIVLTMIGFALVKTWPPATAACEHVLGWLVGPCTITPDPTDLLALPFALWAWPQKA